MLSEYPEGWGSLWDTASPTARLTSTEAKKGVWCWGSWQPGSPGHWENVRVAWLDQTAGLLSLAKVKTLSYGDVVLRLMAHGRPHAWAQGDSKAHLL